MDYDVFDCGDVVCRLHYYNQTRQSSLVMATYIPQLFLILLLASWLYLFRQWLNIREEAYDLGREVSLKNPAFYPQKKG